MKRPTRSRTPWTVQRARKPGALVVSWPSRPRTTRLVTLEAANNTANEKGTRLSECPSQNRGLLAELPLVRIVAVVSRVFL